MARDLDRRAVFFWLSAIVVFLLVPVTPDDFVWVGIALGSALTVLGAASWLDHYSRRRGHS